MRDNRTHQELADKEFSTATCGNVVGAPSFPSTPSMNPSRRTGPEKDVLAALAIFEVFAAGSFCDIHRQSVFWVLEKPPPISAVFALGGG
jgi:hypothetical protein